MTCREKGGSQAAFLEDVSYCAVTYLQNPFLGEGFSDLPERLARFGREGSLRPVESAYPLAQENRLEFLRERLDEWYVNDDRGLEQGFTLHAPPEGRRDRFVVLEMEGEEEVIDSALEYLRGMGIDASERGQ